MTRVSTLFEVVDRAMARYARWCPPMLEVEDLRQEAWVAVLEAQNEGVIDPDELQRRAELRIKDTIRAAANDPSIPMSSIHDEQ